MANSLRTSSVSAILLLPVALAVGAHATWSARIPVCTLVGLACEPPTFTAIVLDPTPSMARPDDVAEEALAAAPANVATFKVRLDPRLYDVSDSGVILVEAALAQYTIEDIVADADAGSGEAQYLLGAILLYHFAPASLGERTARDELRKSAEAGFERGKFAFANMLRTGNTEAEREAGLVLIRESAARGFPPAQVAQAYWHQAQKTKRVDNDKRAQALLESAAQRGNGAAITGLAQTLLISYKSNYDPDAAEAMFQVAAKLESPAAMRITANIAYAKDKGPNGLAEALRLLRRASELGDARATSDLASILAIPKSGVEDRAGSDDILAYAALHFENWDASAELARRIINKESPQRTGFDADANAITANEKGYPVALQALMNNALDGTHGHQQNKKRGGELARIGFDRFRTRKVDDQGSWPIWGYYFAKGIQTALATDAIEPRAPDEKASLDSTYGPVGSDFVRISFRALCMNDRVEVIDIYVWNATTPESPTDSQFDWQLKARSCGHAGGILEEPDRDILARAYKEARDKNEPFAARVRTLISEGVIRLAKPLPG